MYMLMKTGIRFLQVESSTEAFNESWHICQQVDEASMRGSLEAWYHFAVAPD